MPPSPPSLRRVKGAGGRACNADVRPSRPAGRSDGRTAILSLFLPVSTPSCTADSAASHVRRRRHAAGRLWRRHLRSGGPKRPVFARGSGCGGGTRRPPSSLQMPAWQGRSPACPAAWCWAAGRAALACTRRATAWANARTCTIAHARRPAPGFVCGHWQFPRGCGPSLPRLEPSSSGSKDSLIC